MKAQDRQDRKPTVLKLSSLSRRELLQLAGASTAVLAAGLSAAWGQSPQSGGASAQFQNPLFAGDYPDASVLRVGGDFYMTHSCDHYGPQLVVWHSRDLVNWLPASIALDHTYGGVWAPDLVEHQGQYYIYFPMNGDLFVVHTTDPRTSWSAPIDLKIGGIDPGHVVGPDGTRYLYAAGGGVIQLSADGLSTVGQRQNVYDGWKFPSDWKTEGFWLESPKLTRRGQYYYMTSAEGGTSGPPTSHMAVVARSPSPLGPWENSPYNPLIHTYSADEEWWSVGHGTLVSTPDDRWYIVYHGYRNGFQDLGRHTLMEPVVWTPDDWPRAPLGAKRADPMPAPMGIAQRPMLPLSDNFRATSLKATWRAWDESDMTRFQAGPGALTIRAKGNSPGTSSPLTVTARDTSYQVQVVATPQPTCGAALGLFYDPHNWLFAELRSGQLSVYDPKATLVSVPWAAQAAHLKIDNRNSRVEFLAGANGKDWQSLVAGIDVSGYQTDMLHGFLSLRPALAASGMGEAQFSGFIYRAI
jgi:xylan 1,4-beta-xylosidase